MPSEKERLLTAASSQRNIYIASIVEFAIETGMRRSEILKLRWCDVDLENGFASLYDTKNGEDRRVPLTRRCIEVLQTVLQTDERVFPISATCLRLAWNRARNKAGITDLRFHDLRHEAVSRFFEMGMSVPEVALISGHKDVRQLFRYTHLNPENVFKKYEAF
jgi:integrase